MLIQVERMTKKTKVAKGFLNGPRCCLGPFLLYKSQLAFTMIHPIHHMYHSSAIYKATDKQGPYKRMKKCAYCHVLKRCKYGPTFVNTVRRPLWRKASVKHFLWISGCGWKERSNSYSCWHKMPRYRTVVHHEFLRVSKVWCLLFVSVLGCVLFVCMFMVFEICNSMEMSFWVGFDDGTGLLL
jgi:hypothetical protein